MYVRQHPGAVIRELWLNGEPYATAAHRIGIPLEELVLLLEERTPLTPRLAAKLEAGGWSNASFWLRLQDAFDQAQQSQSIEERSAATGAVSVPSAS